MPVFKKVANHSGDNNSDNNLKFKERDGILKGAI